MMKSMRLGVVATMLATLVGCGGAGERAPATAPKQAASEAADSPQPSSDPSAKGDMPQSSQEAPSAAPSSAPGGFRDDSAGVARKSPEPSRQGLGTEWGESRTSRIRDVSFVRADGSRPMAVTTLHYNDRNGVDALMSLHGARTFRSRDLDAVDGMLSVSVRDSSGDPFEALRAGERTFVIGRVGERYSIVIENRSNHRFEAVATVDGLDVINGRAGSMDNRGYVMMPFATVEIDGFRQSASSVAAFRFGAIGDSYAAQKGAARNVGVIGIAFFGERGDRFDDPRDTRLRDTANPFPGTDRRFAAPPGR